MSKKINQVFKCKGCDFSLEVLTADEKGCCEDFSCCGEPMVLLEAKNSDTGQEKHVPILEKGSEGIKIKVGSVPHPMEEKHYIEWIEVINGPYVNRKHLKPGEDPVAEFYVPLQPGLQVRAYCNVHGLWKS
jgi:superoxide reductase